MNRRAPVFFLTFPGLFFCSNLLLETSRVQAALLKELQITSHPEKAKVFLKRGRKELPLGETPLTYTAKFHSKISVLRLIFKKRNHEDLTLKISPANPNILAKLTPIEPPALVLEPMQHNDSALAELQESLNPSLTSILLEILEKEESNDLEIVSPLSLTWENAQVFLKIPLATGSNRKPLQGSKQRKEAALKELWSQILKGFLVPISALVVQKSKIKGVVVEVGLGQLQHKVKTTPRVVQTVEMQCKAGYDPCMQFNSCASSDGRGNCIGGMVPGNCYNPCKFRVPVTKSEVKIDTEGSMKKTSAQASFRVFSKLFSSMDTAALTLENISYSLTRDDGKVLLSSSDNTP